MFKTLTLAACLAATAGAALADPSFEAFQSCFASSTAAYLVNASPAAADMTTADKAASILMMSDRLSTSLEGVKSSYATLGTQGFADMLTSLTKQEPSTASAATAAIDLCRGDVY